MTITKEWKRKPISYHLSTIGIKDVFCTVVQTVPDILGSKGTNKEETLEFTGAIKVNPEDFVVREIGGKARLDNIKDDSQVSRSRAIANLTDANTLPPENDSGEHEKANIRNEADHDKPFVNNFDSQTKPVQSLPLISASTAEEVVQLILTRACICRADDGINLVEKLKNLSEEAASDLEHVDKSSSNKNEEHFIIIPPIIDEVIISLDGTDTSSSASSHGVRNRGTFHRTLKLAFPLLKSSTLSAEESLLEAKLARTAKGQCENDDNNDDGKNLRYLKVEKDCAFQCLVPHLLFPERDLPSLYRFRNNGCTIFANGKNRNNSARKGHGKKRKHESESIIDKEANNTASNNKGTEKDKDKEKGSTFEKEQILLYLKPTVERKDRKEIHYLISQCYRDFETGTKSDVHYHEEGEVDNHGADGTTTAIMVQWSRRAQDAALKRKNKMNKKAQSPHTNNNTNTNNNTLCVVKKRRQEHLSLINHLVAGLKCRQSDIGLAGIKDTQAVTYQYCTLRNISPSRARNANAYLKHRNIELGNFQRASFSLNQGDSQGNDFEIIVRDMKRVETKTDENGVTYERFIPCQRSHVAAMADRVRDSGFVNFFGEQRIGEAGPESEVGTRSSDIGRLMLHGDFAGAIDLLMKGRNKRRGGDFIENEEARKMRDLYITSNGNVDLTLSAFPRGNGLARERTVLQGLKRYGKDKPLDALKCLNFNVRMFWINAYQSLIWNKMASERMLRLGAAPAIGDLFMDSNNEIEVVTEANLDNVELLQIVLPLPGYRTRYPENFIGDLYVKAMEQDGVKFVQDTVSEATAKGSYRPLIVSCDDITWEEVISDQGSTTQMQTDDDDDDDVDNNDAVNDIKFHFSLRSGSYATMCLREIMSSTLAR
jgi:TruD family tRNA pseudouridine synthase